MNKDSLSLEKQHLAGLLEAVQRCSYFLNELNDSLPFPLSGEALRSCCKDRGLFDSLEKKAHRDKGDEWDGKAEGGPACSY